MAVHYIVSEQFSGPDPLRREVIQKAVQHWLSTELAAEQSKSQNQPLFARSLPIEDNDRVQLYLDGGVTSALRDLYKAQ